MTLAAEKLVDWSVASSIGQRVAGGGVELSAVERARLFEDFAEVVPEADALVAEFTRLAPGPARVRPWVMSRNQWLDANLRAGSSLFRLSSEVVESMRFD